MAENHPTKLSNRQPKHDLAGQRFGRLTVLAFAGMEGKKHGSKWECLCDCGATTTTRGYSLRSGHTQSCGCLQPETATAVGKSRARHGHNRQHKPTAEYMTWQHVKARCERATSRDYYRYGGRGIRVCQRWSQSFEMFLSDVGPRPSAKHSLDRIDNNGHYEPGNVRWATAKEQGRNKRTNRLVTYQGETLTMTEWSERTGINLGTLWFRLHKGWPAERALTEDVKRAA